MAAPSFPAWWGVLGPALSVVVVGGSVRVAVIIASCKKRISHQREIFEFKFLGRRKGGGFDFDGFSPPPPPLGVIYAKNMLQRLKKKEKGGGGGWARYISTVVIGVMIGVAIRWFGSAAGVVAVAIMVSLEFTNQSFVPPNRGSGTVSYIKCDTGMEDGGGWKEKANTSLFVPVEVTV